MKKIILLGALAGFIFTSCGSKQEDKKEDSEEAYHEYESSDNGTSSSPAEQPAQEPVDVGTVADARHDLLPRIAALFVVDRLGLQPRDGDAEGDEAAQHAVAVDVGVDDGGDAGVLEAARELARRDIGRLGPAGRGNLAVARIDGWRRELVARERPVPALSWVGAVFAFYVPYLGVGIFFLLLVIELVADGRLPEGVPLHLKLDTGMGRLGTRDPAEADRVAEADRLAEWLAAGRHGSMRWMESWFDKRVDPRRLVDGMNVIGSRQASACQLLLSILTRPTSRFPACARMAMTLRAKSRTR